MAETNAEALPPLPDPEALQAPNAPAEAPRHHQDPLEQMAANRQTKMIFWVMALCAVLGMGIAVVVIATGHAPDIKLP